MPQGLFRITALAPDASLADALRSHWREYLMEATELAALMFSLCTAGTLLYGYRSPLTRLRLTALTQSTIMGIVLATATFLIIQSPFGRRSGAHFNPALTLAYLSVGRVHRWDALWYILAQFTGGLAGVSLARLIFGTNLSDFPVQYVVTLPGRYGYAAAFLSEFLASLFGMIVVLVSSNSKRLSPYSPIIVATMTVLYFTLFRPLSTYSVNPARSFSSALFAHLWQGMWIYFIAPSLGTITAIVLYKKVAGPERLYCAKVFHDLRSTCPFDCRFHQLQDAAGHD